MNFDIASLPLPARITPVAPISDLELLQFSRANRPLRMEREGNGDIIIMTPTGNRTGRMNQRLGRLLDEWAEQDGRGVSFDSDTGFKLLNGSVRSPDASWLAKEKWDALTEEQQDGFGMCPDFIVELASPSERPADLRKKIVEEWLLSGVQVAWLIDPKAKMVTIFRLGEEPQTLYDPTSVQGTGPMLGFQLVLNRLWAAR